MKVSFGWQGMIREMDEMVIGLFFKDIKSLITFILFYYVPRGVGYAGGRGEPLPPMTVTCPGLKGVESVKNSLNTCFIGLLKVCLYRYLLPRLQSNLGIVCDLIIIIHTRIILCAKFNHP